MSVGVGVFVTSEEGMELIYARFFAFLYPVSFFSFTLLSLIVLYRLFIPKGNDCFPRKKNRSAGLSVANQAVNYCLHCRTGHRPINGDALQP